MLKTKTAYLITKGNANVLSHISGFSRDMLEANIGWCATYDESERRRWGIIPAYTAVQTMGFELDTTTYNYGETMTCKNCNSAIKLEDAGWVHVGSKLMFCSLRDVTIAEPKEA